MFAVQHNEWGRGIEAIICVFAKCIANLFCKLQTCEVMAAKRKLYAGAILRETRLKFGLTQKDFAKSLGVSVSYLNQMENKDFVSIDHIERHSNDPVILAVKQLECLRFSGLLLRSGFII